MELKALLYYRSRLDEHDQAVYDALVRQWMHFEAFPKLAHPHCDFLTLTRAVHFDYPLLFFVNYYEISFAGAGNGVMLRGSYLYEKEEAKDLLRQCEVWGTYIRDHIPAGIGVKEQALWLHDVLASNTSYGDSNGIRAHNLIGAAKDRQAVCEGIAMAYKFLCDLAGIPCIFVPGTLHGAGHAWNLLWLDGGASFVDVTNDIAHGGTPQRRNFLRSSSEMYGYTWDEQLIPPCRIRNLSHPIATAHNTGEVLALVKALPEKGSLSICLKFGYPLQHSDFKALFRACLVRNPSLALRNMTYSLEAQRIEIH